MRHLISMSDLSTAEIERIFAIAEDLKAKCAQGLREAILPGRVLALLFEKPSLRTRVSFEAAIAHLGGSSLFLGEEVGFGRRESIPDFARVISQYVDGIVVRAKRHRMVEDLAKYASCPVINGLTDLSHPCQAMADLFTLKELAGNLKGHTLAWIGDGNNVARCLAMGCGRLGMKFVMATPEKYRFPADYVARLKQEVPDLELGVTADPIAAVGGALAVYTDVWTSMGQEGERDARRRDLAPFQVNATVMANTQKGCVFMHCLPAHRGEEVTDDVLDGKQSVVVQQAANRMHIQKAILTWLLTDRP